MRNKYSFIACCLIALVLVGFRLNYPGIKSDTPLRVTTWDAMGYYLYLPSTFIYHDLKELSFFTEIDQKYELSGGHLYQAQKCDNGNYFFKYLGGVALMELPAFFIGHWIANISGHPADGFSMPYQLSIIVWVILINILAIFLLRRVLLRYFDDLVAAITLVLLLMASNYIQYVSIDSAMSHAFIFPLYVAVIYTTIKWHERPSVLWASLTGFIIGLAVISRPTELIIIFIPLLWNNQVKDTSTVKWQLVKKNKKHLIFLALFGFMAVIPQLIYWKYVTGSWIYDVGSKWDFLNPHFRVLFGFECGWFIYTPVTVFFIVGMFFMKKLPFKKAVITFCLLNIYIIIAWHDWRYGASYSCRALVQSYPLFALPLAAFIHHIRTKKWRFLVYAIGIYLVLVNVFQLDQYINGIIHYRDMNRKYYSRIYLNTSPSPLIISLLDTDEIIGNEDRYRSEDIIKSDSIIRFNMPAYHELTIADLSIDFDTEQSYTEHWIKVEASAQIDLGISCSYLYTDIITSDSTKQLALRLFSPISKEGMLNEYAGFISVPKEFRSYRIRIYLKSCRDFSGKIEKFKSLHFYK